MTPCATMAEGGPVTEGAQAAGSSGAPPCARVAELIQQGHLQAALPLIEAALQARPDAASLHLQKIACLEQQGPRAALIVAIDRGLRACPGSAPLLIKRAEHMAAMLDILPPLPPGLPETTRAAIQRRLPPALRQALDRRRQARRLMTDLNRRSLEALLINPRDAHACFVLSDVLRHGAYADLQEAARQRRAAAEWLDRAIRLAPHCAAYRARRHTLMRHDTARLA